MKNGKMKLLIVNNNLTTGGVQHSLVNLINGIKYDYEITLFLFCCQGEYREFIPPEVNIIEALSLLKLLGVSQKQAKVLGLHYYLIRGALALYTKILSNHLPLRLLTLTQEKLFGFDAAISFLHCAEEKVFYAGCNEFVLNRVSAKQKIAFLHCDFFSYEGSTERNISSYKKFDKIATVSEGCKLSFIRVIPELKDKTFCVCNCHNYPDIIFSGSYNPVFYETGCINIVTVARLSREKGILRGIKAVSKLLMSGYRFEWHIIGDGGQRAEIEDAIVKNKLTQYIHLYGNQSNPFRYIKNADLFLLTSFHEAAPMVIEEAKCLGVPVLTTDTVSANEMVAEGKEGFICENSENGIYEMLKKILDNPQILDICRENLAQKSYSNERALLQFHNLIHERI